MLIVPILLVAGGTAALIALLAGAKDERPVPDHEPDERAAPGSTGYKKVDALLPELRKAADSSKVPLGLLVAWIAKESGGKLSEVTKKYDERGYFQLMPAESTSLIDPETGKKGLDHKRLSTDSKYSINAGLLLIGKYMRIVDALHVAKKGTAFYWLLVKLCHAMGEFAVSKIVSMAREAGAVVDTWRALEQYAEDHEAEVKAKTKHSATKWFRFCDEIYDLGKPFGFGDGGLEGDVVVGDSPPRRAPLFTDIPDPLDVISPKAA